MGDDNGSFRNVICNEPYNEAIRRLEAKPNKPFLILVNFVCCITEKEK